MPSVRPRKPTLPCPEETPPPAVDAVDTRFLRTLVGYNTRRASLAIIEVFMERMAVHGLKVVEFSVLSLVAHNPGITSRQLCATLNVLPPNLVGLIAALERRGLIERRPHPSDGRAMGVHLTPEGKRTAAGIRKRIAAIEDELLADLDEAAAASLLRAFDQIDGRIAAALKD